MGGQKFLDDRAALEKRKHRARVGIAYVMRPAVQVVVLEDKLAVISVSVALGNVRRVSQDTTTIPRNRNCRNNP